MRVCEGGRSAYVQGKDKGGKVVTFLRNRRFMIVDPKYRVEKEAVPESSMVTREARIAGDSGLTAQLFARKAQAAFCRTRSSLSGIMKGGLTLLPRASSERPARWPGKLRRRAVTWGQAVAQRN